MFYVVRFKTCLFLSFRVVAEYISGGKKRLNNLLNVSKKVLRINFRLREIILNPKARSMHICYILQQTYYIISGRARKISHFFSRSSVNSRTCHYSLLKIAPYVFIAPINYILIFFAYLCKWCRLRCILSCSRKNMNHVCYYKRHFCRTSYHWPRTRWYLKYYWISYLVGLKW